MFEVDMLLRQLWEESPGLYLWVELTFVGAEMCFGTSVEENLQNQQEHNVGK